jgi:hypothetical protein
MPGLPKTYLKLLLAVRLPTPPPGVGELVKPASMVISGNKQVVRKDPTILETYPLPFYKVV